MPIFAMFTGVFALSSLAFPGTNSFIGEFLVLSGGCSAVLSGSAPVSMALIVCLVPGVVLAAAYMLRMLQKVAYGGTRNPDHSLIRDLGLREVITLLPLMALVFWIGLNPVPFTRVIHKSVEHLLEQTHQSASAYVTK
jgi:NADH-quinone oxidoreductase subunit M